MKKIFFCFSLIFSVIAFSNPSQAQHKKLSDQGRGAIIGGAGGAVAGGLIGHGVGGALVGGAIGAGGGYIIGNEHRKNVEKRKRANWRAHHTLVRRAKYRYHN
jgi:uncharacterized protein YcfJ